MPFKKGEVNNPKGRKKGSRNKANIFTEAFDQVYERELGSGDGVSMFLEKTIVRLKKKVDNEELNTDQLLATLKALAPYYNSKHTSTKTEVHKTDNTVSGKLVREVNESRMAVERMKAELKEVKRQKLKTVEAVEEA